MVYKVGQVLINYINHPECIQFDIDDDGAIMLVLFNKPTQNEIEQFNAGKNFEIRFTELSDIILITAKIGDLSWVDAPYNAHLSKNLTKFTLPNDGEGISFTLVLVDASSGEIKSIRLMGLSTNFTRKLFGAAMEQKTKEFNEREYDKKLHSIYQKYDTNTIVKMSSVYCKVR